MNTKYAALFAFIGIAVAVASVFIYCQSSMFSSPQTIASPSPSVVPSQSTSSFVSPTASPTASSTTTAPSQTPVPPSTETTTSPTVQPTLSQTRSPTPTTPPPTSATPPPNTKSTQSPAPTSRPAQINVGGLSNYKTIQSALVVAQKGDTIRIATGTYNENILLSGSKTLILQGGWNNDFTTRSNDSSLTIIDGAIRNSVITIQTNAGDIMNVHIEGLTIQNGKSATGGGINIETNGNIATGKNSTLTLTIHNNQIINNIATEDGGGIRINAFDGSNDTIFLIDNQISNNTAATFAGGIWLNSHRASLYVFMLRNNVTYNSKPTLDGGGIACYASDSGANTTVVMENNLIYKNVGYYGGGMFFYSWGSRSSVNITLTNNIVACNHAFVGFGAMGIMASDNGTATFNLTNNDIVHNYADGSDGGIFIVSGGGSNSGTPIQADTAEVTGTIQNNIIIGNRVNETNSDITVYSYLDTCPIEVSFFYCAIEQVGSYQSIITTDNALKIDPEFVDAANGNFELCDDSAAIDAGNPLNQFNDAMLPPAKGTVRCDLGAYGGYNNFKWLP